MRPQQIDDSLLDQAHEHEANEKRAQCLDFLKRIKAQRKLLNLPELHHHDLEQYVTVLINGASLFHMIATMQCSDRIDLVDSSEDGANPACDALESKFIAFTRDYLGLNLMTSGDPRGAVWKIKADRSLSNGWENDAIIVPSSDRAYFSF